MKRSVQLLTMLNRVNKLLGLELDLNYASHYGGWQLTNKEGSHIVKHRVSIKEMYCFLDGMIIGVEECKKCI
tara:strand:- start:513 stop:728 length:216 start_codon:yes stop_codon:yes gene_type:complete